MTLTRDSVLHYWDPMLNDEMPTVGGNPHHTRNSSATWIDQRGIVQSAIVNTPRKEWLDPGDGFERRKVMRLEHASTNPLLWSNDFSNAAWTKSFITVTSGVTDPAGGVAAQTITATGSGSVRQTLGAGSSLARVNSIWCRRRTGAGNVVLWSPDTASNVLMSTTLTAQWQRFSVGSAASTSRDFLIELPANGDAVDLYGAQMDDVSLSSYVATNASTATRAVDAFYWDFIQPPQALMAYIRFIERGSIALGCLLWQISNAADTGATLSVYGTGGVYNGQHTNGTTVVSSLAVGPVYGNTVELVLLLQAGGNVRLDQSIGGGAVTSGALSGVRSLATAWSDTRLWLNGTSNAPGMADFLSTKVVKYADVVGVTATDIMAELRAFELDARGGQL